MHRLQAKECSHRLVEDKLDDMLELHEQNDKLK